MKREFILFIFTCIVSCHTTAVGISRPLAAFHEAVNRAKPDLGTLWAPKETETDEDMLRQRRTALDEIPNNFANGGQLAKDMEQNLEAATREKSEIADPQYKEKRLANLDKLRGVISELQKTTNLADASFSDNPAKVIGTREIRKIPKTNDDVGDIYDTYDTNLDGTYGTSSNHNPDMDYIDDSNSNIKSLMGDEFNGDQEDANDFNAFDRPSMQYMDSVNYINNNAQQRPGRNNNKNRRYGSDVNSNSEDLSYDESLDGMEYADEPIKSDKRNKRKGFWNDWSTKNSDAYANNGQQNSAHAFDPMSQPLTASLNKRFNMQASVMSSPVGCPLGLPCGAPSSNRPLNNPSNQEWNNAPTAGYQQLELAKNDLSHEADYKLSKLEQDAADVAGKRRDSSVQQHWEEFNQKKQFSKRDMFNAMNEIKLKTAHRMMDKGYGPSLPSNSLAELQNEISVDSTLNRMEAELFTNNKNQNNTDSNSKGNSIYGFDSTFQLGLQPGQGDENAIPGERSQQDDFPVDSGENANFEESQYKRFKRITAPMQSALVEAAAADTTSGAVQNVLAPSMVNVNNDQKISPVLQGDSNMLTDMQLQKDEKTAIGADKREDRRYIAENIVKVDSNDKAGRLSSRRRRSIDVNMVDAHIAIDAKSSGIKPPFKIINNHTNVISIVNQNTSKINIPKPEQAKDHEIIKRSATAINITTETDSNNQNNLSNLTNTKESLGCDSAKTQAAVVSSQSLANTNHREQRSVGVKSPDFFYTNIRDRLGKRNDERKQAFANKSQRALTESTESKGIEECSDDEESAVGQRRRTAILKDKEQYNKSFKSFKARQAGKRNNDRNSVHVREETRDSIGDDADNSNEEDTYDQDEEQELQDSPILNQRILRDRLAEDNSKNKLSTLRLRNIANKNQLRSLDGKFARKTGSKYYKAIIPVEMLAIKDPKAIDRIGSSVDNANSENEFYDPIVDSNENNILAGNREEEYEGEEDHDAAAVHAGFTEKARKIIAEKFHKKTSSIHDSEGNVEEKDQNPVYRTDEDESEIDSSARKPAANRTPNRHKAVQHDHGKQSTSDEEKVTIANRHKATQLDHAKQSTADEEEGAVAPPHKTAQLDHTKQSTADEEEEGAVAPPHKTAQLDHTKQSTADEEEAAVAPSHKTVQLDHAKQSTADEEEDTVGHRHKTAQLDHTTGGEEGTIQHKSSFGDASKTLDSQHFDNVEQSKPDWKGKGTYSNNKKIFMKINEPCNHRNRAKLKQGNSPKTKPCKSKEKNRICDDEEEESGSDANCDQKLIMALRDEILNCTAFAKLESYLKSIKNKSDTTSPCNPKPHKTSPADCTASRPQKLHKPPKQAPKKYNFCDRLKSMIKNSTASPPCRTELSPKDLMKLNITIDGLVMRDKQANKFFGNGTINVRKGCGEERGRRGVRFPMFGKRKITKPCQQSRPNEPSSKRPPVPSSENTPSACATASNKVSTDIVRTVFSMVRKNPKMKSLWPSLKRNHISQPDPNAGTLRKLAKAPDRACIEDLVRKAMSSVNKLIEEETRARNCVSLPEELAEFYEMILSLYAQQTKNRDRRQALLAKTNNLDEEVSKGIEIKSGIVKKLLKQYDELPQTDKYEAVDIRDDLLRNMLHLRKMQYEHEIADERRKREASKRMQALFEATKNSHLVSKLDKPDSPQFVKLNSAAETLEKT